MPKIVVEGPDGRKFAFPDTMPRAEINAFMKQKYGTKAPNESVQDYLARYGREQAATEARAKDIDREATAAGRAEGERAAERMGVDNPLMMAFAAPAIGLAQQEGGRRVLDREGTVLADEAAGLSAINAAGFFVPGMVNKEFGARVEEGRRQQPLAAFAGDVAGGFGPGEIIGAGVSKAVQSIGPGMAALGRMLSRGPGPDAAPTAMPDAMPAGGYFGRKSMRPPGSGPSAREIETQQQWATATPIVTQARTTAQTAQQAADAALQSKAPADIARAKDQKKALVGQLQEAQASRAGMDTPEDARLSETLASLTENTSDPVLLSTQISAAKTSLDRLLTDIGSPVEGNLIPVKTNILTRTQAPRSAAEGPQDRASVTRYAEGQSDEAQWNTNQTFFIGSPNKNITKFDVRPTKGRIGQGVYATPQRELAQSYTKSAGTYLPGEKGGKVYEVYIRGNLAPKEEFYKAVAEAESASDVYKTKFASIDELDKANQKVEQDAQRILKERGFTGFVREHYADGQNLAGEEVVIFDPSNVRRADDPMFKTKTPGTDDVQPMGFGASTPKTPQRVDLSDGYNRLTRGSAEIEYTVHPGGRLEIESMYVDPASRGKGEASRALDDMLAAADARGLKVDLTVDPLEDGGMTQRQLEAFYKSRGFVSDGADGMVRPPPSAPQQAARFETPGSPEYEAAVAKGLDMSQAGRMARAKEMGFDTDTVLYHGTTREFDQFDLNAQPNMGNVSENAVFLTPDPESAANFANISGSLDGQLGPRVMPLVVRGKIKHLTPEDVPELRNPRRPSELVYRAEPFVRIIEQAKREGFAGVKVPNVYDVNKAADQVIVFDPSNIRSVNAAFDPEKSTSSTLLAAAPFAAVGGAGLTSERELGSKMKRDKKD